MFFCAIWFLWANAELLHLSRRKAAHRRGAGALCAWRYALRPDSRLCAFAAHRPSDDKEKRDEAPSDVEAAAALPTSPTLAARQAAHAGVDAPPAEGALAAALADQPPPSPPHHATHHATWRCVLRGE